MITQPRALFVVFIAAVACTSSNNADPPPQDEQATQACLPTDPIMGEAAKLIENGRQIFRFDTFGSEAFWGGELRLHQAIVGERFGGVGPGITPRQALELGLKVDSEAIPAQVAAGIRNGQVSLDDVATTVELLKLNAVIGVTAFVDALGTPNAMGIQCALCHSTVDDSFLPGVGKRLDGWPNRDLNIGAIVAAAPTVAPLAMHLGVDEATVRAVLTSWGPGRYDAELNLDGKAFRPDGKTAATVLPAAFGLLGVNLHTYTGWGSVPYWNAFVANLQMRGQGTFFDPRLKDETKFPLAAKAGFDNVRRTPDLISAKLAPLHYYQLSLAAPSPPSDSFNVEAADRGGVLFSDKARCATCHVPPLYIEPGWPMHTADEIGIDDFQAQRSPDGMYRTTPLRGLFTRAKRGFYHDGRFADLPAVVEHYDAHFMLALDEGEKSDLVEFLKSL